jgi:uncharacterized protein YjbJ (UPF0337 family)
MKDSTKDKIEGKGHELKGSVKKAMGHAVGNPDLQAEGAAEKADGKVQQKVGKIERKIEKALDRLDK